MAVLTILNEHKKLTNAEEITTTLASHGIDYEQWTPSHPISDDAPPDEILNAYSREIEALKTRGGYVTADVIDVSPATPGLDALLAKFNREHWHDEDEVRFTIAGHGLFHIHTKTDDVLGIEVEAGDLIRIPRGTLHWFNLCADRRIRAIRLFQDTAGWTPHYTESRIDENFVLACFSAARL
jgi:1,2-dihydroxy-3-keto-5-methylthiopentene dioxygenase